MPGCALDAPNPLPHNAVIGFDRRTLSDVRPAVPGGNTMKQWEYCTLRWQGYEPYPMVAVIMVSTHSPRGWNWTRVPEDSVPAVIERLGLEGWEMVSVYGYPDPEPPRKDYPRAEYHWAYFKRPKRSLRDLRAA